LFHAVYTAWKSTRPSVVGLESQIGFDNKREVGGGRCEESEVINDLRNPSCGSVKLHFACGNVWTDRNAWTRQTF